jgi:hypothetical protein
MLGPFSRVPEAIGLRNLRQARGAGFVLKCALWPMALRTTVPF